MAFEVWGRQAGRVAKEKLGGPCQTRSAADAVKIEVLSAGCEDVIVTGTETGTQRRLRKRKMTGRKLTGRRE